MIKGWEWSKMGVASLVMGQFTVSEEWTKGINWVFACCYIFAKIKSLSKDFWWCMVKNGCDQPGYDTLNLAVPQKWIDKINRFFTCWHEFRRSKSWVNGFFGWAWPKMDMVFSSWDPKISCNLRTNLWIELIFWMLITIQ